jgi:choline dehydrogenase-like flavoprotein
MRQNTRVTFAMRDLDRLKCIQAVVDGDLKPIRAADRLGLTTRQVRRLARRYTASGPVGLISQRFNRPSNNHLDDALADRVIKILRSTYADFGPTLATEKLRTKHGIKLAKETVRRLQIAVGLWIPRKLRPPKIHQPRMRRACLGELVQIDGCDHHWFEDRGPSCGGPAARHHAAHPCGTSKRGGAPAWSVCRRTNSEIDLSAISRSGASASICNMPASTPLRPKAVEDIP